VLASDFQFVVPGALTTQAPAVTSVDDTLFVAWSGESGVKSHSVYYSILSNGQWTAQASIPNAKTTAAPALGVVNGQVYLATTPPGAGGEISLYVWNGAAFVPGGNLCGRVVCAKTGATPALFGNGDFLYAAWTTPEGAIDTATLINGVWFVSPTAVPNATTNPSLAPTLAVFDNQLYVSWVDTSEETISTAVSSLPLSSRSWSAHLSTISAQTAVAPSMGVFGDDNAASPQELFLSWTTPSSTISFARWQAANVDWVPTASPVPLPSGPLTSESPALSGVIFEEQSANGPLYYYSNNVAFTRPVKPNGDGSRIDLEGVKHVIPGYVPPGG